ncbi:hypothetical protein AAMO2058_000521900 [Amorphochlora amoebiformis]
MGAHTLFSYGVPVLLLCALLTRWSLLSFGYGLFLVWYFLEAPFALRKATERRIRLYMSNRYWVSLSLFSVFAMILHIAATVYRAKSGKDLSGLRLIGLSSFINIPTDLGTFAIDFTVFVSTLIAFLLARRAVRATSPPPVPRILHVICNISVPGLMWAVAVAGLGILYLPYLCGFLVVAMYGGFSGETGWEWRRWSHIRNATGFYALCHLSVTYVLNLPELTLRSPPPRHIGLPVFLPRHSHSHPNVPEYSLFPSAVALVLEAFLFLVTAVAQRAEKGEYEDLDFMGPSRIETGLLLGREESTGSEIKSPQTLAPPASPQVEQRQGSLWTLSRRLTRDLVPVARIGAFTIAYAAAIGVPSVPSLPLLLVILAQILAWREFHSIEQALTIAGMLYATLAALVSYAFALTTANLQSSSRLGGGTRIGVTLSVLPVAGYAIFNFLLNSYDRPRRLEDVKDALEKRDIDRALRELRRAVDDDDEPLLRGTREKFPNYITIVDETVGEEKARGRETLLHRAASAGASHATAELVKAGAQRDAVDESGRTPLEVARYHGRRLVRRGIAGIRIVVECCAMGAIYGVGVWRINPARAVYMVSFLLLLALKGGIQRRRVWICTLAFSILSIFMMRMWDLLDSTTKYKRTFEDSSVRDQSVSLTVVIFTIVIHLALAPDFPLASDLRSQTETRNRREPEEPSLGVRIRHAALAISPSIAAAAIAALALIGGRASILSLGHVASAMTVIACYYTTLDPARILRPIWPLVILYAGTSAAAQYLYQDPSISSPMKERDSDLIGLEQSSKLYLALHLLPEAALFTVNVILYRVLNFIEPSHPHSRRSSAAEGEALVSPQEDKSLFRMTKTSARVLTHVLTTVCTATAVGAALSVDPSAIGCAYIFASLLLFAMSQYRLYGWVLGGLAFFAILSKYTARLPTGVGLGSWGLWVGVSSGEEVGGNTLFRALTADFFVFFFAAAQRTAVLMESTARERRLGEDANWGLGVNIIGAIQWVLRAMSIQLAVLVVLMMCVARHNAVAILLILLLAAYPLRPSQRERLLWVSWLFLQGVLFSAIVFQYVILMGYPPFVKNPKVRMPGIEYMRFYLLGGYSYIDLTWDIIAFFFLTLAAPFVAFDTRRARSLTDPILPPLRPLINMGLLSPRRVGSPSGQTSGSDLGAPEPTDLSVTIMLAADRLAACMICILVAATGPSLLSLPPLLYALYNGLGTADLSPGPGEDFTFESVSRAQHARKKGWEIIQAYNFFVIVALVAFQTPFVPSNLQNNGKSTVDWSKVIGVAKLQDSTTDAITHPIALRALLIFLLIDTLDHLFWAPAYKYVLERYYIHLRSAKARACLADAEAKDEASKVEEIAVENARRVVQDLKKMNDLAKKGNFRDDEVWPTPEDDYQNRKEARRTSLLLRAKSRSMSFNTSSPHPSTKTDSQSLFQKDSKSTRFDATSGRKDSKSRDVKTPPAARSPSRSRFLATFADTKEEKDMKTRKSDIKTEAETDKKTRDKDSMRQAETATRWESFKSWCLNIRENSVQKLRKFLKKRIDVEIWIVRVDDGIVDNFDKRKEMLEKEREKLDDLPLSTLIWRWAVSHTEEACYLFFFLNLWIHANVISAGPALAALLYAILEHPRPPRAFWRFCHWYLMFALFLKITFQLPIFCVTSSGELVIRPDPTCRPPGHYSQARVTLTSLFGLRKLHGDDLIGYLIGEIFALIALAAHRHILGFRGQWTPESDMSIEEVISIPSSSPRAELKESRDCLQSSTEALLNFLPVIVSKYFRRILTRDEGGYADKLGSDLIYIIEFGIQMIATIYIITLHARMAAPSAASLRTALASNRFSGEMVVCFLIQVLFILWNRIAYLRHSLFLKLGSLYASICFWIPQILFYWPRRSRLPYSENPAAVVFLIIQVASFAAAAYQIRYGYPQKGHHDRTPATRPRQYIFQSYRLIPFVFEIRTLLDWTFTESSLDLWERFTLEDVYANMYIIQCELIYHRRTKRGEKQSFGRKISQGGIVLFLVLIILFGPLILFSSANPVTTQNNVKTARFTISLSSSSGAFPLLDISSTRYIRQSPSYIYDYLEDLRVVDADDAPSTVQEISFGSFADNVMSLAPPTKRSLIGALRDTQSPPAIVLNMFFERPGPPESPEIHITKSRTLTVKEHTSLADILEGKAEGDFATRIDKIIPPVMRLPATGTPRDLISNFTGVYLSLKTALEDGSTGQYWEVRGDGLGMGNFATSEPSEGVVIVTVSSQILPSFVGAYSVIGLYITIVLTIGNLVRLQFSGQTERVMYKHLMDAKVLLKYCECIATARRSGQLELEEELFRHLMKVLRTPSLLITLTRRTDPNSSPALLTIEQGPSDSNTNLTRVSGTGTLEGIKEVGDSEEKHAVEEPGFDV